MSALGTIGARGPGRRSEWANVLAIEVLAACQGIDFRRPWLRGRARQRLPDGEAGCAAPERDQLAHRVGAANDSLGALVTRAAVGGPDVD